MDRTQIIDILNSNPDSSEIIDLMSYIAFDNDELDINFYKAFYPDLGDYTFFEVIKHYYFYGIKENRIPNKKIYKKIYPDFVLEEYKYIYHKECENKTEYQIFYDYAMNYNIKYPNFHFFKKEIIDYDLNLHYILNKEKFDSINFFDICLDKIDEEKNIQQKENFKNDYEKYYHLTNEINTILNCNKNFNQLQPYLKFKKEKNKNLIFDKNTFYEEYPDFDFNFYSKQIFIEENTKDLELYCINYFVKYGLIERHFINEEIFTNFFYLKNLGDNWLDIYKMSLKSKTCTYLILNNYEGGSYKFYQDLVSEYSNNYFKVIKNEIHLKKINFKENDKIFIQYIDGFSLDNLIEIKKKFNVNIFISVHDFYWFSKKIDSNANANFKNYLNNTNIEPNIFEFMQSCDRILCPSNFVYSYYLNQNFNNVLHIQHNDYNLEHNSLRMEIKDNTINLAILTNYTIYKGKLLYEILSRIYKDKYYNGCKINILRIGKEIESYDEKEFFDLIIKYNINGLLYLNNFGETWSYCLSKGLKTGLPILYNNIGSFVERIDSSYKYRKFFENEIQINKFIDHNWNENIFKKFEDFLDVTIKISTNKKIPLYKNNFDFSMQTSLFYDSLLKRVLPVNYIDFYAVYNSSINNFNNYHLTGIAVEYNMSNEEIDEIFNNNKNLKIFFIISDTNLNNFSELTNFFKKDNYLKIDNSPVVFLDISDTLSNETIQGFKYDIIKKCKENIFSGCIFVFKNSKKHYDNNKYYSNNLIKSPEEIDNLVISTKHIQSMIYNENIENKHYEKLFLKLSSNYTKNADKLDRMFLIDCNNYNYFLGLTKSLYSIPLSL